MLYSRKIVLAIAACVAVVSAMQEDSDAVKAAREAHTAAQTTFDEVHAAQQEVAKAHDALGSGSAEEGARSELETKIHKLGEKLTNHQNIVELAKSIITATQTLEREQEDLAQHQNPKADKTQMEIASLCLDYLRAEKNFRSTENHMAAAAYLDARAKYCSKSGWRKTLDDLPMEVKCCEAVFKALEAARVDKANAAQAATDQATKLADATKTRDILEADKKSSKDYDDLPIYKKFWQYLTTPYTKYRDARDKKVKINGEIKDLGFFGGIKHALWPSTKSGKATYLAGAAAITAGVVGGLKYNEHRKDQRTSDSRKKWGLGIAAGLAATGAAYGGYKALEAHKARQEPGQPADLDEDGEEPQTSNKTSSGSPGQTKKGNKQKSKGSSWMIWAAVIVLGLAAIGGAVYYFLFMNEEGSEEDAVPEGMDQV